MTHQDFIEKIKLLGFTANYDRLREPEYLYSKDDFIVHITKDIIEFYNISKIASTFIVFDLSQKSRAIKKIKEALLLDLIKD